MQIIFSRNQQTSYNKKIQLVKDNITIKKYGPNKKEIN